ncbi:MAG: hypothetical protein ACLS37_11275 [Alistipes sp.]
MCVALAAVPHRRRLRPGKVETGNITIGGDQTAFEMPLANRRATECATAPDVKAISRSHIGFLDAPEVPPTPTSGGSRALRTAT